MIRVQKITPTMIVAIILKNPLIFGEFWRAVEYASNKRRVELPIELAIDNAEIETLDILHGVYSRFRG